jgi:putative addiction module component (TIGR02574 family)
MNLETVLKEVERWPAGDQIELVERLWDRLRDAGWEPEPTDELKAELDRRATEVDTDPGSLVTWDSIVEYIRRKR